MSTNFTRVFILAVFLLTAAPPESRSAAPKTRETVSLSPEMGRLVPPDAVGLLYFSSVDEVEADFRQLADLKRLQPPGAEPDKGVRNGEDSDDPGAPPGDLDLFRLILQPIGVDPSHIDRTRPMAVALNLSDMGQPVPMPTFIVPVADWEGLRYDLESNPGISEPLKSGDYAGLTVMPGFSPGEAVPPIATGLPSLHAVLRLRTNSIMTILNPYVESMFTGMLNAARKKADGAPSDDAMMDARNAETGVAMIQWYVEHLRSCETIDLGIETADGRCDFGYVARLIPGAEHPLIAPVRAEGLLDLAKCLPREYPAMSLTAMDFSKFAGVFEPVFTAVREGKEDTDLEPSKRVSAALIMQSLAMSHLIKDQALAAGGVGEQGLEMVQVFVVHDPEAYLDRLRETLVSLQGAGTGMSVEWGEGTEIDGLPILTYRIRLDPERPDQEPDTGAGASTAEADTFLRRFFGGDAPTFRVAAVGDRIVMVTFPDPSLLAQVVTRLREGTGRVPSRLTDAARESSDPICLWYEIDVRELMPPLLLLAAESTDAEQIEALTKLRRGEPVRISGLTTVGETGYQGRCSVDLEGLAGFFRAMTSILPDRSGKEPAPE